jgi:hypothetical protein
VIATLSQASTEVTRLGTQSSLISSDEREADVFAQALDERNRLDKIPLYSAAPIESGAM